MPGFLPPPLALSNTSGPEALVNQFPPLAQEYRAV